MKNPHKLSPLFQHLLEENLDRLKVEKPYMERHAAASTMRLMDVDDLSLEDSLILAFMFGGVIATYHDEMMKRLEGEDKK